MVWLFTYIVQTIIQWRLSKRDVVLYNADKNFYFKTIEIWFLQLLSIPMTLLSIPMTLLFIINQRSLRTSMDVLWKTIPQQHPPIIHLHHREMPKERHRWLFMSTLSQSTDGSSPIVCTCSRCTIRCYLSSIKILHNVKLKWMRNVSGTVWREIVRKLQNRFVCL